ncbi:MAG: M23 family metallopeptidase [Candidatus Omnitrophota bacterium]
MKRKFIRNFLKLFLSLAIAGIVSGIAGYAYLEFYYYRDRFDWVSPLPSASKLQIRRDAWGKGDFGARRNGGRRHRGVDLLAEVEDPVAAVRSGRVRVGEVPNGMGIYAAVTHRDGLKTIYGHLTKATVKDRSRVRQGQRIGLVGRTGNAADKEIHTHLHFEIRRGKEALDPMPFLNEAVPNNSLKQAK